MGGLGSHGHRTFPGAKATTDQFHTLDIRQWSKLGLLDNTEPFNFDWTVDGSVTATSRVKIKNDYIYISPIYHVGVGTLDPELQRIRLYYHRVNFGGYRTFLMCPGCGERKCLLYAARKFLCRFCLKLVYPCSRQSVNDLDWHRHAKACAKLGWEPYGHIDGVRPAEMHQDTFKRLKLACVESADLMRANFLKECGKMFPYQGDSKLNR